MIWACLVLASLLAYTSLRVFRLRKAMRLLEESMRARRPLLNEDVPGTLGPAWDDLCVAVNELISTHDKIARERTGQVLQLEATLGSIQEAVLIVDSNNYVLFVNQALSSIFPQAKDILGQRVELALHSREFMGFVDAVKADETPPRREIEFFSGSQSIWVEATGAPIPALDGANTRWALFVLHDVTRQKHLETLRKDFVANVSHELRTPLSIIKGYSETLIDGHREMSLEDRDQFIRTIHRHSERLHSLLEDLLVLSRLESQNPGLHRELVHLGTLVSGLVNEIRSRPDAKDHQFKLSLDSVIPELLLDPLKLTQVFENLFDNALKYTPKGSVVETSVRRKATEIEVRVCDNGPGIPSCDLARIFERFYRVDKGRSRDKGGTGLGLSIVKHIVQLHGGRVWAESTGNGTSFVITLPLRTSSGEKAVASQATTD